MTKGNEGFAAVREFYDTHPINLTQILDAVQDSARDDGLLDVDVLQHHDQDHYDGPRALDILAAKAGIEHQHHVLDVGSGMGGPARYIAARLGCRVTGLDLTESRVLGARELTRRADLQQQVQFQQGSATQMPFDEDTFDIAISQEAMCHMPQKARVIAECARVLNPGGTLAFTDIVVNQALTAEETTFLADGIAQFDLQTFANYRQLLVENAFHIVSAEDLSAEWTQVLTARLRMYQSLEAQTVAKFGAAHFAKWDAMYSRYVALFVAGKLGGGRFVARQSVGDK